MRIRCKELLKDLFLDKESCNDLPATLGQEQSFLYSLAPFAQSKCSSSDYQLMQTC